MRPPRSLIAVNSPQKHEGLARLETLLQRWQPGAAWPLAPYTALAVKANLGEGDLPQAKALLKAGLEWEPESSELRYLSRIVERHEATRIHKLTSAN